MNFQTYITSLETAIAGRDVTAFSSSELATPVAFAVAYHEHGRGPYTLARVE